ncbi:MAG: hypothetical protein R2760_00695 [Chitinophagales bacterium]
MIYSLILISIVSIAPSCSKKDAKVSAKDEVVKLLTWGKWFNIERYGDGILEEDCFNKSHYLLFSPDGTMIQSYNLDVQSGVYSVNEDGKSMSITLDGLPKIEITSVTFSESNSKLTLEAFYGPVKKKLVYSKTSKSYY